MARKTKEEIREIVCWLSDQLLLSTETWAVAWMAGSYAAKSFIGIVFELL
jgi:hypothetical protein